MVKGSSRMPKKNIGDARNSIGIVKMTVLQDFIKKEAELKKQIEALKLRDEELKAQEKNLDPKVLRLINGDLDGIGLEELKNYRDKLVEMKSMINDHLN